MILKQKFQRCFQKIWVNGKLRFICSSTIKVLNFKSYEIIAPCLNFGTAISSITLSNLTPVFVDCNVDTLQIDCNKIEKNIKKTKALLIPNLIGNLPDWKK